MAGQRSAQELRQRIQEVYDASERLDAVNYCGGRLWLADYAGNVDVIADALLDILDGKPVLVDDA